MPIVEHVRCVLLSSPYADEEELEVKCHYPNGPKRTVGMVEVTLDNGVTGLGEGYLAVFAPHVFESIVDLCAPHLVGADAFDIGERIRDLCRVCDYWSLQGAARHVISAFDIALVDAKAKSKGVPAFDLLGGGQAKSIRMYGSGGCCYTKKRFQREATTLHSMGIDLYKIRALTEHIHRTAWILNEADRHGIEVGVDMCQNLANPAQPVDDVVAYVEAVHQHTDHRIVFLEEAIGPADPAGFKALRRRIEPKVCGGEIITTPAEMIDRMKDGIYDFVQPDASVIGGISATLEIFCAGQKLDTEVVVHAWGGPVAIMANYHAAFAGNAQLVEYPMFPFPLRQAMMTTPIDIEHGRLLKPTAPGIGVTLTPEIEAKYRFDRTAVYNCRGIKLETPQDDYWR